MTSYRAMLTRAITMVAACALAGAVVAALAPAVAATGTTRYVDDTGDDGANDCLAPDAPCLTIQHALDQALDGAGETIAIGHGTFSDNLTVGKSVTIAGAGEGETVISNGTAGADSATVTVTGSAVAVVISGVTINHATPSTSPDAHGVVVETDATVTIEHSGVAFNGGDGISLTAGTLILSSTGVTANHGNGITLSGAAQAVTVGSGSFVSTNGGDGVKVSAGSLTVDFATISENQKTGITVTAGASAVTVGSGTIKDNASQGLQFIGVAGSVTNSTVSGNGTGPSAGSGITFNAPGKNLGVTNSVVSGNARNGIAITGGTTTVAASTLTGNGSSGIYVNAPPVPFRAPGRALLSPSASAARSAHGGSVRMPRPESTAPVCPAVNVNQSTLSGNHDYGAAVYTGALNVNFSTLSANTSGGIFADNPGCATTVLKSTVSGNGGPGIDAGGAGLDVTASTIADNTGTGIEVGAGVSTAEIYQSTIAGNGGAAGLHDAGAGSVSVGATIIANNTTTDCSSSPAGIDDAGYNLSGDASCGLSAATHSIANGDPKLAPLASNGGSTPTMALGDGSDALDQIPGASPLRAAGEAFARSIPGDIGATCLAGGSSDQRGVARPQNGRCDIGAYESVAKKGGGSPAPTPTPTLTSAPPSTPTSAPATTTSRSTTASTVAAVLGAGNSAATPRTATIAVKDLAQTGIGADRVASVGIVLLVIGAMLLVALARRESGSRR